MNHHKAEKFFLAILVLAFASGCERSSPQTQASVLTPVAVPSVAQHHNPNINYDLNAANERFFIHLPNSYKAGQKYGLIVFIDSEDAVGLPSGWEGVLDARNYLFVAPQNAGNDQNISRRLGLAVLAVQQMKMHYSIDPDRVFAAGFSGGARMAGLLGFYHSDIFRGTIQSCGVDFYKPVPVDVATSSTDTSGQPYGLLATDATPAEIDAAKHVRFALVTGTNDFRHGNILDIYNGGFKREEFNAKLFDVPGMGHDVPGGATLTEILDFLESSS
jgi:predicted esterase